MHWNLSIQFHINSHLHVLHALCIFCYFNHTSLILKIIFLIWPESHGIGLAAATVSAGLWRSQRAWVLQRTVSSLPPLCVTVSLRQQGTGWSPHGWCVRWDPHSGQTKRGRVSLSEPTPTAPTRLQEPSSRDSDNGEENQRESWGAVHGLDGSIWNDHYDTPACLKLIE